MEADEEDEEDAKDVHQLNFLEGALKKLKNDRDGQFHTFHPFMVNDGKGLYDDGNKEENDNDDHHGAFRWSILMSLFFTRMNDTGSPSSTIQYYQSVWSNFPLVHDEHDAVRVKLMHIAKTDLIALVGKRLFNIWSRQLDKGDCNSNCNLRSFRKVVFNTRRNYQPSALELNFFKGLPYPELADPDMDKVQPVQDFILDFGSSRGRRQGYV